MVSDADLWKWLEVRGWVWSGKKAAKAPQGAMRKRFQRLDAADQALIIPMITVLRTRINDLATARAAVPVRPPPNDPTILEYQAALLALRVAELEAIQACNQVRTQRARHATSAFTVRGLNNFRDEIIQRGRDTQAIIDQLAADHPAGTPPRTPPRAPSGDADDPSAIPPPPTDAWLGAFRLAPGGQAAPVVYVKQNRHGRIIDRVCIKDTEWPGPGSSTGVEEESLWDPDPGFAGVQDQHRTPSEIGALNRLNLLPNSQSIIKLRNWARIYSDPNRDVVTKYRTFLEWCDYGDLYDLSRKYTPYKDRGGIPRPPTVAEQDWIPEPFIWACALQLVNAGKLMQRGAINSNQPPEWSEIIHRDLKPDNVFLAHNTSELFKGYPQIKVGDFGLAAIISTAPARHLTGAHYCGMGTPLCMAWEQFRSNDDGSTGLSYKTNVWGIGIIIWGLMHSRRSAPDFYQDTMTNEGYYLPRNPRTADFSDEHKNRYSDELRGLILDCLRPQADDRPTFDELSETIEFNTAQPGGFGRDLSQGLRKAAKDDPRFVGNVYSLRLSEERYAMYTFLSRSMENAPAPVKGQEEVLTGPNVDPFGVEPGEGVNEDGTFRE